MAKFQHPCPTRAELEALANRPTLDAWEMADLIQGFAPRGRFKAYRSITWLNCYEEEIEKLRHALRSGEISEPVRPIAFVEWASSREIPLPEHYVDSVLKRVFVLRRPRRPDQFNEELVRESGPVRQPRRYDSDICQQAREVVLSYVRRHGTRPPKPWVDKEVAAATGLPLMKVTRAYAMQMLLTKADLQKAQRAYRRQFHNERLERRRY